MVVFEHLIVAQPINGRFLQFPDPGHFNKEGPVLWKAGFAKLHPVSRLYLACMEMDFAEWCAIGGAVSV